MLSPSIEARWIALVLTLPDWISRLRHPTQFWPQFEALVAEIEVDCTEEEVVELRRRSRDVVREHWTELS